MKRLMIIAWTLAIAFAADTESRGAEPAAGLKTPAVRAAVYTRNYGATSLTENVHFADAVADDALVVQKVTWRRHYHGGYTTFGPRYGYFSYRPYYAFAPYPYAYRPYYYRPYYAYAPYPYAYRPYCYTFGPSPYFSYYPRYAVYAAPRYYGCYHW